MFAIKNFCCTKRQEYLLMIVTSVQDVFLLEVCFFVISSVRSRQLIVCPVVI